MMGQDLLTWTAVELSARIAAREVSAVEVMTATLDRIDAVNGPVNAIVSVRDRAALLDDAAAADVAPRRGWLHGIPMAIKDLADAAGIRTTSGSPIFADFVPPRDELMVARLKAAGAIVIGKTNTPEFGLGSHSFNPVFGVTASPYDLSRSAGGSSGGAAAALAARMVCVADGSDAMGSLRNPAAFCNVYGMRPTWGLVPGDPTGELFLHQLSTDGPMARCPADLAALLETLAGPDRSVPWGAAFSVGGALQPDIRGKRIGWLGDWGGAYAMDPGITALCETALRVFDDLGASVDVVAPPFPAEAIWDSWITLRGWDKASGLGKHYDDPASRTLLKPEAIWEVEQGCAVTAAQVQHASALRSDWFRAVADVFQRYDALVLPSAQVWPFPLDWRWPRDIAGRAMDTYHRWMEVVIPVSLLGLPAIGLPAGFGPQGLPMGMQLIGPRGADLSLLRMAEAYHRATDWPGQRPPPD